MQEILKKDKLFIIDWDDTLCITTIMSQLTFNNISSLFNPNISKYIIQKLDLELLDKLDIVINKLLIKCLFLGTVIIVSNAQSEWIHKSCKLLYPKSYETINKSILIISARELCNNIEEKDMCMWKIRTYRAYLDINPHINKIISLGDADSDLFSIKVIQKLYKTKTCKFIKFESNPTSEKLYDEIVYVNKIINNFTMTNKYNNIIYLNKIMKKEINDKYILIFTSCIITILILFYHLR